MYKYFSGTGKVFLNTSKASPAPERYQMSRPIIESTGDVFQYTSSAPKKPRKYFKTPFRRRRSIYTHFSDAGDLIYTYLAPERPEKYLYTPDETIFIK